ncbi:MAG: NADP-specific glutamate dehydrogenase [Erysipelotrichaceae bacterium]|nr:NADP-specific glutamate dehydrogenase [Erysipelotrichaceae bacterium]
MLPDLNRFNNEPEFQKALKEMFSSLDKSVLNDKRYLDNDIFNKIIEPDRIYTFDVKWVDDKGVEHVNKGYRVQFNNVNGVYKGGLRFHPSVNLSILKFLAFEQIFKNYLTTLPMGGAKGGSDFDPKGKSDAEVIRFCQAFMKQLYPYIGVELDVPAGDIGVGAREIRAMYLAYKEYSGKSDCSLTGKPLDLGGSLCRTEATGFGVTYFAEQALNTYKNTSLKGKTVVVSGSGNVALYCLKKVTELGGKVVAMNDSSNAIYNPDGIDFESLREIKEVRRGRIKEYKEKYPNTEVLNSKDIWGIKCDVAFPCATQFELDENDAQKLISNGVIGVFEGANMPCTLEAAELFIKNKIIYSPGKASNAGGVAVSGLEIEQNKKGEKWSFDDVDHRLQGIMSNIFNNIYHTAKELGDEYNLVKGANNYAFKGIADKMLNR